MSAATGGFIVEVLSKEHDREADSASFYARYGFDAFPDQPRRLFLPMKTIGTLTESSSSSGSRTRR